MPLPAEVFLSHATADRASADLIGEVLERHGVRYWYSRRNIRAAQQWHDEIGEALARCDWLIVLISDTSVRSRWVKREVLYSLDDDRYEDHVLPIRIDDADHRGLSWTLGQSQMIDLREGEAALRAIVGTWNLGYRRP